MPAQAKTQQTFQELGIGDEAAVEALVGELRADLEADLATIHNAEAAEQFRVRWLGRKQGLLGAANDHWLKSSPGPLKRSIGRLLNELRARAEGYSVVQLAPTATQALDVTLPGKRRKIGARHPIRMVHDEIEEIFFSMGYSVETGPEIETDYYNFEALGFPKDHPSRDTQDTFFIGTGDYLLRTHTSPVQIRTMEKRRPPLRAVVLGKVYRRDAFDASHSPMFHQMECFAVDTNVTLCDLKGTLNEFIHRFFGPKVKTRFRPSFFPFTEPSVELDISCLICGGSGCPVCKRTGWVELLGSGMIDPKLYGFVNYDASKFSGFAFGVGLDRLTMMKYGIDDIHLLFQGDTRFLRQFA